MSFFKSKPKGGFQVTLGPIQNSLLRKKEILTESEMNHHVHIVGASGYGKTVLIMKIIKNLIVFNKGFLFLDLKGDIETSSEILENAKLVMRKEEIQTFSLTDPKGSVSYNPLSQGNATQLRDKIMASFNWSEEYYKNQASSYLLKILTVLAFLRDQQNFKMDFFILHRCLTETEFLISLSKLIPSSELQLKEFVESCHEFLCDKGNYNSLQGLRSQIESLIYSEFGSLLKHTQNEMNFFKAIDQQKILLIFLDSRRYSESSIAIGRMILQDLKGTSAKIDSEILKLERKPFSIIIDEFSDFAQEDFIGFLDRARSSKMSVTIAHQELCDLQRISPEFAGRLMGNTSTMYVFLQKRPESAEVIAQTAGTKLVTKKTLKSENFFFFDIPTGDKSLREVEEFIIHPKEIKSLVVGKCIAIKKYPYSRAHNFKVRM